MRAREIPPSYSIQARIAQRNLRFSLAAELPKTPAPPLKTHRTKPFFVSWPAMDDR
jgi:hypothetical protein